jgi:hypothetical protein
MSDKTKQDLSIEWPDVVVERPGDVDFSEALEKLKGRQHRYDQLPNASPERLPEEDR